MIKLIAFDLDGTIYDPNLYFRPAFKTISKFLAQYRQIQENSASIEKKFWEIKRKKGSMYKKLFNDVLDHYGIRKRGLVKKIVALFHSSPLDDLKPYKDTSVEIKKFKKNYKLAVVTHGNKKNQIRILKKIKLFKYFDFIISAKDEGLNKTDPNLFYKLLKRRFRLNEIIYVGDNPLTDFSACRKIGIKTVRLLRGEFAKTKVDKKSDAEFYIKDFSKLENIIEKKM